MKDILQGKFILTRFNISAKSFSGKRYEPKIVKGAYKIISSTEP